MSYILDALNKAERERKRGQIPSLETADVTPAPRTPRNPWLWVAAFAVIFNAILAGLLIYSSSHAPDEQQAAADAPATPIAVPAPATPSVAISTPPAAEIPIHRAIPPVNTPAIPLMTDQELQAQARELAMEAPVEIPPPAVPIESTKIEPPAAKKPAPVDVDDTPLEMIPLLAEKPLSLQQEMPAFRVDVHVYDGERANRFVMINLQRYREGDDITEDLRLERITREGMVLEFRGERFRYLMKS